MRAEGVWMPRAGWAVAIVAAIAAIAVVVVTASPLPAGAAASTAAEAADDLPPGIPPAATRTPVELPAPNAWPFAEAFPRTSGTGRVHDGAFFWSDFLYDDHGAVGAGVPLGESPGAPSFGTFRYPDESAANNGADIFRTAIGVDGDATWWRVDWNTLADPRVPIAAFAIDVDGSGGPAVTWPAGAGVSASGADRFVVVSGTGAWVGGADGALTSVGDLDGTHVVDADARSFLVRLPQAVIEPRATSTVWLAAGLANAAGDGFLPLTAEHGALPGQPAVYNVAFRDYDDEPARNNFWFDTTQATTLATPEADVTTLAAEVDWDRLRAGERDPEPRPTGWTNRWYASSVELGDGKVTGPQSVADNEPNYLGRVQPYGIYVPSGYAPSRPAPLTWILHSFTINHNQYAATAPTLVRRACEERDSICVTTLQRGPDGGYEGVHQLDFWEVWGDVARTHALDPQRTTIGGYSMGGFGTFHIALDHPDLFGGMFILASAATRDLTRLENARSTPYYHAHGVLDQLVPYPTEARPTIDELDRLGYRYRFDTYPTKDHIAWSLEDGLYLAAEWLAAEDRTLPPDRAHVTYRWFPEDVHEDLGFGPDGAWWLRDLVARDDPGRDASVDPGRDASVDSGRYARVDAVSGGLPAPVIEPERRSSSFVDASGAPVQREELIWNRTGEPSSAGEPRLDLDLVNVAGGRVVFERAGLEAAPGTVLAVVTDGRTDLALDAVPTGTTVLVNGDAAGRGDGGAFDVSLDEGTHEITFAAAGAGEEGTAGGPARGPGAGDAPLPATGGGAGAGALALVALAGAAARKRLTDRMDAT